MAGIVGYSGQRCDAIKLVLAEEGIYEALKAKIVEKLSKVKVGDPHREGVVMGPLRRTNPPRSPEQGDA